MNSNPRIYHRIENFQELQLAKHKLKLTLDYSEKRIEDQYDQLKSKMSLENLGIEAGKWAIHQLQNRNSNHSPDTEAQTAEIAQTNHQQTDQTHQAQNNHWLNHIPHIIKGVLAAIEIFSTSQQSSEPKHA